MLKHTSLQCWILFLLLSVGTLKAADPKIGLVLGGGGARGAAHVGVLKVLEEQGIAIDYIAGTSMGAIVGSLYAYGYSADEIEAIIADIDWTDSLTDNSPRPSQSIQRKIDERSLPSSLEIGFSNQQVKTPQGLIQGQHLNLLLRRLLAGQEDLKHFDQLPIPFRAIACDISTGEAVILESGDLVEAVRASMSVPGVFQPVKIDGRLLVDGGVVDNVPVKVAQQMGADHLIVVDVGSPLLNENQLNSPFAVTEQVFTVLTLDQTKRSIARMQTGDVLIRPELGDINSAQFNRAMEAIPMGQLAARQQLEPLKALTSETNQYDNYRQSYQVAIDEKKILTDIEVDNESSRTSQRVAGFFNDLLNTKVSRDLIEQKITELYGEGRYEKLTYRLERINEQETRLVLFPVDKHWGPNFTRIGLKLSDNFDGESTFQLDLLTRVQSHNNPAAEWRFKLGIGDKSELGAAWLSPVGDSEQLYIKPYAHWRAFNQSGFLLNPNQELARFRWNRGRLGLEYGYDFNTTNRVYVNLEGGRDKLDLKVGPPELNVLDGQQYGFVGLGFYHDSLNAASFPTAGQQLNAQLLYYSETLGNDVTGTAYHLDWKKAFAYHDYSFLAGVKAATTTNDALSLQALNFLGGLGHLSGMAERQIGGTEMFFSRFITRKQIAQSESLVNFPMHLGFSLEAGNVWGQSEQYDLNDLIYAGSIFMGLDTPLGPFYLGYGRTNQDNNAIYLQFGSLLNQTER